MGQTDQSVGLFAAYAHSEVTYSACSLAQTLQRLGYRVAFLTSDKRSSDIHYAYDRDVVNLKRRRLENCGINLCHMLWFDVKPPSVKLLRRIEPTQQHSLILTRETLKHFRSQLGLYDNVICTRQDVHDAATRIARQRRQRNNYVYMPWESELPIVSTKRDSGERSLLAVFDSRTRKADDAIGVIRLLLSDNPSQQVTIWHTTAWDSAAYSAIRTMQVQFKPRLTVARMPSALQRWQLYREHDCAWFVTANYDTGALIADALASHCPVLGYDSPPFSSLIDHGKTGQLIECETSQDRNGIVTAKIEAARLYDILRECLHAGSMRRQRTTEWPQLETRRREYQAFWSKLISARTEHDEYSEFDAG